jgi:hypothetical protein
MVSGSRLEPGATLGGFVLEQELHRGGMGSLWRARREGRAEPVVVKVPFLGEGEDVSTVIGFEAERMILPRLNGPHAPRFIAAGDFGAAPYLAMEFVPGETLEARLRRSRLGIDEIVAIGRRIAAALQNIHDQHVLHLDVKPANVMLRPDGEVVLLDFGLSRHDELPDLIGEETDLPVGTGAYIAPEQILGYRGDPRSDIFALGVVLYELVTGQLPFGSPQRETGTRKRLWRDPVPPRALNAACPPWLQEVILRCLEVHPDARYSSAAQVAFALDHSDQVTLTARAARASRDGLWTVSKRWFRSRNLQLITRQRVGELLAAAPIVVVAVDLSASQRALGEALLTQCVRVLDTMPGARLACVTVLKTALLSIDETTDAQGQNIYVQRLIELKDWARPLKRGEDSRASMCWRLSTRPTRCSNMRGTTMSTTLSSARAPTQPCAAILGSVSAKVVAEASCTVTVVRLREGAEERT